MLAAGTAALGPDESRGRPCGEQGPRSHRPGARLQGSDETCQPCVSVRPTAFEGEDPSGSFVASETRRRAQRGPPIRSRTGLHGPSLTRLGAPLTPPLHLPLQGGTGARISHNAGVRGGDRTLPAGGLWVQAPSSVGSEEGGAQIHRETSLLTGGICAPHTTTKSPMRRPRRTLSG